MGLSNMSDLRKEKKDVYSWQFVSHQALLN